MSTLPSPTFQNLIDEVLMNLHGHTADLEQLTYLTSAIGTGDLSYNVGDASQVTRGLVEIDSELMWVTGVDQTSNIVNIAPFGRGFRETTAASHLQNSQVMNNPRFPRQHVKNAIQETLFAIYPDIYAINLDETNIVTPVRITYPVNAAADAIRLVQWQTIGPSQLWMKVRRWKFDPQADAATFPSGKSIDIYDKMVPGRPIKISYISRPGQLVNESDTLASTGLLDSIKDVLIYGACYRLVVNLEASRLQTTSIEQSEREMVTPPGAASNASKYYLALYTQAFQREVLRLQKFFPNEGHMVH